MGDCANCVGRTIVDYSQSKCLSPWWYAQPSYDVSQWICRHRRKVGRTCEHDQDCVFGIRRCLGGNCQPRMPYGEEHICESDLDCKLLTGILYNFTASGIVMYSLK